MRKKKTKRGKKVPASFPAAPACYDTLSLPPPPSYFGPNSDDPHRRHGPIYSAAPLSRIVINVYFPPSFFLFPACCSFFTVIPPPPLKAPLISLRFSSLFEKRSGRGSREKRRGRKRKRSGFFSLIGANRKEEVEGTGRFHTTWAKDHSSDIHDHLQTTEGLYNFFLSWKETI